MLNGFQHPNHNQLVNLKRIGTWKMEKGERVTDQGHQIPRIEQ